MEYWEILLMKQRERGKDGLTIPFLIGSQRYLSTTSDQGIAVLIQNMAINKSFETCIRYCMATQTLIAEIRKQENMVYYPKSNSGARTNLSIGIMLKHELGEDVDRLIECLVEKFQHPIDDGLFSAEPNVDGRSVNWQKFSPNDIKFINDSFASLAR